MQDKLLRLVLVSLQQQGKGTFSFLNDGMSIFTVIIIWISKNFLWKKNKQKKTKMIFILICIAFKITAGNELLLIV